MLNNVLGNLLSSHSQMIEGFAIGFATAHIPLIMHLIITSPWVLALIKAHPQTADAIVDALTKEVHSVADTPAPTTPPTQPSAK